ncbi:hypothetical protein F0316_15390 [Vibrio cholerae]|nr:hypothetical protein F0316_15390 [Vibrio cholerae]
MLAAFVHTNYTVYLSSSSFNPYLQRQVVWVLIRELALAAYQFHRYFKIHFMFQFKVFLFLKKGFFSFGWVFFAI